MRTSSLAVALLALSACSFATSSTVPTARFGYGHHGARVALLARGEPDLIATWRSVLAAHDPIVLAESRPLDVAEKAEVTAEHACPTALELARSGAPVDEVVVVTARLEVAPKTRCTQWKHTKSAVDRIFSSKDSDDDLVCVASKYISTEASAKGIVQVYDGRTCRSLRRSVAATPTASRNTGKGQDADKASAVFAATQLMAAAARTAAAELYPSGLAIADVSGRQIVAANADPALTTGAIYVVRGHPPGKRGALGRMRVTSRDGDRVTLEAEEDLLGVGPGDELRRQSVGHLWTIHVGLITGALRTDRETSAVGGAKIAFRWEPSRLPLFAETELAYDYAPEVTISHTGLGLALGARWPRGALRPYAFGEAGLIIGTGPPPESDPLPEIEGKGTTLVLDGTYLGAGLGVYVDFDRWFLLADVRWRRQSMEPPKAEPGVPDVSPTDRETTAILIGAAAGYRF
jgi:hypothetical protein